MANSSTIGAESDNASSLSSSKAAYVFSTADLSSASKPLSGATVQLTFANVSAVAKTGGDGKFSLTADVPLNTALAGYQELTIKAQPTEPWQAAAQTKTSIFALNSVSTSLALASSLTVFAVAYMRLTKTKKTKTLKLEALDLTSTETPKPQAPPPTALAFPQAKFEGAKGNILRAYIQALAAVQSATGNMLTPAMTLREFTQTACPRIGDACTPFTYLTTLAEKSLYSPHTPQPEEEIKAQDYAADVRRILHAAT
jgi:hypothetical protein